MTFALNAATAAADPQGLLRRVLLADAAVSVVSGLLLALAAGPLADPLGLPPLLLRVAGIVLLPFAALLWHLATRPAVPRRGVWAVIVLDALWVVESGALLLSGWVAPTGLGTAFVIAQALVVLGFAEATWMGLRRAGR